MVKPFEKPIYVTRPFLPPLEEFCRGLEEIWETRWVTNNGPILQRFTQKLGRFFETDNVCVFSNGTLGLQISLQGMGICGEVITTPFTFVATTHALVWNRINPVFVDIEPAYYTIDPGKVEAAVTRRTTAILAVHIFGHPCKMDALADIAKHHKLKLIYDAAHAFGVKVAGKSIAHFGDLSMFSLHATKLFHSLEGGVVIFREAELKRIFDYLKNFGFKNEVEVVMAGTNAKMNEMQALMGTLGLKYLEKIIQKRAKITELYRDRLQDIPGIRLVPCLPPEIEYNHAYMPIEIDEEEFGIGRDELYEQLKRYNVFTRRYYYPLVCDYACYRSLSVEDPLTIARRVADRILTLPIYDSLQVSDVEAICEIVDDVHRKAWGKLRLHPVKSPCRIRIRG